MALATSRPLKVETYSYDARVIQLPSLKTLAHALMDFVLMPIQSWTRGCHAARVSVISASGSHYLWLTNHAQFHEELRAFIDGVWLNAEELGQERPPWSLRRGIQFDVLVSGRIFKVYTYMAGSICYGGFDKYALK